MFTLSKKYSVLMLGFVASIFCVRIAAQDISAQVTSKIKSALHAHSNGKVKADSIYQSKIPGLYEVTEGSDVFYVDQSATYAIVDGRLIDLKSGFDYTSDRLNKINAINFNDLPLNLAIKTVRGNGKRVLAVFEDPACAVCRSLHKFIHQLDNVTIYTFPYPVVDPNTSIPRAIAAWCAIDRRQAWDDLMVGTLPANPSTSCNTDGLKTIGIWGEKNRVNNTPTVFLKDGRRLVGATPPDQFIKALDQSSR